MRIATFFTATLFAVLSFSAMDAVAKDEIYRWVDEDGIVHFGDLPDAQTDSESVTVKNSPDGGSQPYSAPAPAETGQQPLSAAAQKRADREEKRRENAKRQEAVAAGCEQRHQLVAQLEPSPRVMVKYEDGTIGRLDDEKRIDMLAEAKAYIAEKCNK